MLTMHKIVLSTAVLVFANLANAQTANPNSSTTNVDAPQTATSAAANGLSVDSVNPPPAGIAGAAASTPATAPSSTSNIDVPKTASTTNGVKTSDDPYVQRRIDKKEAKDEYKAKKKVAKADYKAEKKEANATLKAAQKSGELNANDPAPIGK